MSLIFMIPLHGPVSFYSFLKEPRPHKLRNLWAPQTKMCLASHFIFLVSFFLPIPLLFYIKTSFLIDLFLETNLSSSFLFCLKTIMGIKKQT